jgi:thiol-disulfide isomerase/thioredoxin
MMFNHKIGYVALSIALLIIPITSAVAAQQRIVIEKMDASGLNRLMKDPTNERMIVAMASWCGPCRKELPTLIKLFDKYHDQGLKMVGISLDADGPEAMQRIIDKANVNFPVYWVGIDIAHDYGIYAIPMIFFIKDGVVVEKVPGQRSKKYLEKKIQKLLK